MRATSTEPMRRTRAGVPITGRRVELATLTGDQMPFLHAIASTSGTAAGWPLLGRSVSAGEFSSFLWQMSSLQFSMVRRDNGDPIGLVQGLDDDQRSQTIGVGLIIDPELWRAGWPLEGVVLFLDYLFVGLGYRKAYFTMTTTSLERLGGMLGGILTTECVLRQHVPVGGGFDDLHTLSLQGADWDSDEARQLTGNAPRRP